MSDPPRRRPKRTLRAPVPLYIPDENVRLTDDFDGASEGEEENLSDYGSDCVTDDEEDEGEEEFDDIDRTDQGYAKDGFVVDDDDAMSIDSDYYESEEEEEYVESDEDYTSSDEEDDIVECDDDSDYSDEDSPAQTQEEAAQG